jgi:hypothetical protein
MDNQDLGKGGVKFDSGLPAFDLVPHEPMMALAQLYADGAVKYQPRNWEKGMRWGRVFAAACRHLWKWWGGEQFDIDSKTGKKTHHLIAVLWNINTLYVYETRGLGRDDRPWTAQPEGQTTAAQEESYCKGLTDTEIHPPRGGRSYDLQQVPFKGDVV